MSTDEHESLSSFHIHAEKNKIKYTKKYAHMWMELYSFKK